MSDYRMSRKMKSNLFLIVRILPSFISFSASSQISPNCEDKWVEHFGNSPNAYIKWSSVAKWFDEENTMELHKICINAHGVYAKGSYVIADVFFTPRAKLTFQNPTYNPVTIDTLHYTSQEEERYMQISGLQAIPTETLYLTQGRKNDCVHYLMPMDKLLEYQLVKEICDLSW